MTYFFAKRKRIETFILLDIIAAVAPIGLFFGRIANFINSELYGNPSNVFWSVVFTKIDNIPRHPSQIYEALLEGILLFIILISLSFNPKIKNGLISIAGGGDTFAAIKKSNQQHNFTYISTAGGAFLEWLEGKMLPGLKVLENN